MKNVSAHVDVVMASTAPAPVEAEPTEAVAQEPADVAAEAHIDDHEHKPVQHRDGKERWCNTCGLTADGREPASKLAQARE